MNHTLESQLASYATVLDEAADEWEQNRADGTQSRGLQHAEPRTRRRTSILAAAAAVVLGVVGGVVLVSGGSPSEAWAGWTPLAQSSSPAELAALDAVCRESTRAGEQLEALVFDVRGDGGAAIYGDATGWVTCQADRNGSGDFELASSFSNNGDDLVAARSEVASTTPVVTIGLGWQGDPSASIVWGVRSTSAESIEVVTSDGAVESAIAGDVWVAWWPTAGASDARVRASDAAGSVIVDAPAGSLAPSLGDAGEIVAAVDEDGTDLERQILADGSVSWPEFVTALDAWKACVAADGYELMIDIDEGDRSYEAISQ